MFWDKWCHETIKSYRKAHLKFRKCFCMCNSVFVWDTKASYARYCLGSQRISTIYCLEVLYLFWKKNCNDSHLMVSLDLIVCGSHDTFLLNHSQRCMKSCLKMMINIKFMMAKVPSLLHPHPKFLLIHLLFSTSGSVMTTWMTIWLYNPSVHFWGIWCPSMCDMEEDTGISNFMNPVIFGLVGLGQCFAWRVWVLLWTVNSIKESLIFYKLEHNSSTLIKLQSRAMTVFYSVTLLAN